MEMQKPAVGQRSKNTDWIFALLVIGIIFFSSSRTKTEIVEYEKEPQNKILEYKIINSQQTLYGTIDHDSNTIKVYIPYDHFDNAQ
jgi:hypothetical protein